jgi:hypothetical protein
MAGTRPDASLPPELAVHVQLVDHEWVREQTANGARLALIGPEGAREHGSADALRARLAAAQLEVEQLRQALEEGEGALSQGTPGGA